MNQYPGASFLYGIPNAELPTELLNSSFNDCQPESSSPRLCSEKWLEDPLSHLGRNARALVFNHNGHTFGAFLHSDSDDATSWTCLECIRDQVAKDIVEHVSI